VFDVQFKDLVRTEQYGIENKKKKSFKKTLRTLKREKKMSCQKTFAIQ